MTNPMTCIRCSQVHDQCHGHNRAGNPCGGWPIKGATNCRLHLGKALKVHRAEQAAAEAVVTYGLPRDIEPHAALLEEIARTAGHVGWLAGIVSRLNEQELVKGTTRIELSTVSGAKEIIEAAPSVWLRLYQAERTHLVRVCAAAIAAGIEERRVKLAEEQGALIAQVLRATLDELGVEVTEDVAATMGRHLRALA